MRKSFLLPLLCLLLLGGCASLKADRKVEGNIFSSSYPKMVIEVAGDYEFLGREKKAVDTGYMHLSGGATATLERFMWRSHSGVLVIEFRKLRGEEMWADPAHEWTVYPYIQDTGQQKIGKYGYDYCVLQERDGRFMKLFARNFSGDSLRAHIIYHSSLSTLNLSEFEEDCRNAFTVAGQKLPKTDLQQELEKESLKIASIPEGTAKVSLRAEPELLPDKDIKKMLARYDFYDDDLNWRGSFANDLMDNGDGTITDKATDLMWQKSGSSRAKAWDRAKTYVKQLNKDQFAGYSDWRLPTIEEFASLVEREKVNGVHIDPVFDSKQKTCWSADCNPSSLYDWAYDGWIVKFDEGIITQDKWVTTSGMPHRGDGYYRSRWYIRAVRSSNEEKGKSRLEQRKRHEEKLQLASVPEGTTKVSLRTESKKFLDKDIKKMLARYDFYDDDLNWRGSFANDFMDNGDGTITDKATDLMWQKSGSSGTILWKRALIYVKRLNKDQFAGYSEWRLPTIEELASLVEKEKVNGVHIDPIFYDKQKSCWSADKGPPFPGNQNLPQVWYVNFREGSLGLALLPFYHAYAGERRYVRAVRSLR